MNVAEAIRNARQAAGMTQGELADRLGIALNSVSRWELGQREPMFADLERIAAITGHRVALKFVRVRK